MIRSLKINPEKAAHIAANTFIKNTKVTNFDPSWILALAEVIFYIIKNCDQKNDLNNFKNAVKSANSWKRHFGIGRRVNSNLKGLVVDKLFQVNTEEMVRAILESAEWAEDRDLLDLINFVDHTP